MLVITVIKIYRVLVPRPWDLLVLVPVQGKTRHVPQIPARLHPRPAISSAWVDSCFHMAPY